jgi:hypothetical protein
VTRKIIGICGFIGCGKNTVGKLLVDEYGFQKISYADRLKDTVSTMFGWDRDMLEGVTPESRAWREIPDPFWTAELGYDVTPRLVLQRVGTDCMRKGFDDQTWVLMVKKAILDNPAVNFVVPDVRFYNERDLIKKLDGEVWRVRRGPDPDWTQKAISDNRYDTQWMKEYPHIHESEWRWLDHPSEFERIIPNDGGLEELKTQVKQAIRL